MDNSVWKAIIVFFSGKFSQPNRWLFSLLHGHKEKTFFEYHIVLTDLCVCKTKVSHGESRDLVSWKSRDFHQLRRSPHLQFQGEFGSHFHLNHFALLLGAWSTMVGWGKLWQLHSTHHCYIRPAIFFGAGKKQINIGYRNCSDSIPPKNNSLFE
jgi:hypothetical protein